MTSGNSSGLGVKSMQSEESKQPSKQAVYAQTVQDILAKKVNLNSKIREKLMDAVNDKHFSTTEEEPNYFIIGRGNGKKGEMGSKVKFSIYIFDSNNKPLYGADNEGTLITKEALIG
jgi:hypothetical protein